MFQLNGRDIKMLADIKRAGPASHRHSTFFDYAHVHIAGLDSDQVITDAPSGHAWSSNCLESNVKFGIYGNTSTASYRGCRPTYNSVFNEEGNNTYRLQIQRDNGTGEYWLTVNDGSTTVRRLNIGPYRSEAYCYVIVQAPGGSGAKSWAGIGGRAGGGGGSGACALYLVKVTTVAKSIVVGSTCTVGPYVLNKGGDASEKNGGGAGTCSGREIDSGSGVWLLEYSYGAAGGHTKNNGGKPGNFVTTDSWPEERTWKGQNGGTNGSGDGAGGAGSHYYVGGDGGGGNGDAGRYGSGGGGGSYHMFSTYQGGAGGAGYLEICY